MTRAHMDRTERFWFRRKPRVRVIDGMIQGVAHLRIGDEVSHPGYGGGWIVHQIDSCGLQRMALLIRVQIPINRKRDLPQLPTLEQLLQHHATAVGWVVTNRWGGAS